jgi:hypothetical protein
MLQRIAKDDCLNEHSIHETMLRLLVPLDTFVDEIT